MNPCDNTNPERERCPGCGSGEPLRRSPLPSGDLIELGLIGLCCRQCGRHVWRADIFQQVGPPEIQ